MTPLDGVLIFLAIVAVAVSLPLLAIAAKDADNDPE